MGTNLHLHVPSDPRMDEVLRTVRRMERKMESSMATLREEFRAGLDRLVQEVTETRTATEAVSVTVAGLRDQLQNAIEQDDIDAVRAVVAGLDEVQGQLAQAAGQNIDPQPQPLPGPAPEPQPQPEPNPAPPPVEPPPEGGGNQEPAPPQPDPNAPPQA